MAYGIWVHPPGWIRNGYGEDMGGIDLSRQIMADSLREWGRPEFFTKRMMAPDGISSAFYSWSLERDGLGALVWLISPQIPWTWIYSLVSLLMIFFGVGLILKRGVLSASHAWGFATVVALFNVARHYKALHHYEHLIHHWFVLGLFLDVWIVHRFFKEGKWSLTSEIWRALVLQCALNLGGYYWGMSLLGWLLVRLFLLVYALQLKQKNPIKFSKFNDFKSAVVPLCLMLGLGVVQLFWFIPLVKEVSKYSGIIQDYSWFGKIGFIFMPLWTEWLALGLTGKTALLVNETIMTIGWFYWIPLWVGIVLAFKHKHTSRLHKQHLKAVTPFFIFLVLLITYGMGRLVEPLQATIPTLNFFRVVCRTGLFMPYVAAALLVLLWPILLPWIKSVWMKRRLVSIVFIASSIAEFSFMLTPFSKMPPMPQEAKALFEEIKLREGSTVLDLPFCVAGGNNICTPQFCPNYPASTTALSLTSWHNKKVHGVYLARLDRSQCGYDKDPFLPWFEHWKKQTCFSARDWDNLCSYLSRSDIAAVLVYPDVWKAMREPECEKEAVRRLGNPWSKINMPFTGDRDLKTVQWFDVWAFSGKCNTP